MNRLSSSWLSFLAALALFAMFAQASIAETKSDQDTTPTCSETADEVNVPLAGHSEHGEAYNDGPRQNAYLMGGTGAVDFPVSTEKEEAQQFFDQGLGQLYGFWYYEAERSFRRVAAIDPECAMAYWGLAYANLENKERAVEFVDEAVDKKENATEHEQMYIDAMAKFVKDDREEKDARKDYVKALEKIIRKYPDDIEAKAMLAVHLWQSSRHGLPINSHQAIESLLSDVFRTQPMHSAHHFRIHLWDNEEPEHALTSAARCGQAAPSIAHMWHMPGHIYSRLNRFEDAIYQQSASARVDHAQMMRDRVMPDQISNYAHNNEWLIRNLVHLGRKDEALSLARNMLELPRHPKYNAFDKDGMSSCKYGRRRLLQVYETFEMWDELLEAAETMYLEPTNEKEEQGKRIRFMAIAHYHRGEFGQVMQAIDELEELIEQFEQDAEEVGEKAAKEKAEELDEEASEESEEEADEESGEESETEGNDDEKADETPESIEEERKKKIDKARKDAEKEAKRGLKSVENAIAELKGIQFLARGATDEAIEQFKKSDIAKPRRARYFFLAGDHQRAIELCAEAVKSGKKQVWPLATQIDLLRRMGKRDEAKKAFEELRKIAGTADLSTPLLAKLAKFAKALEYPEDWRIAPEKATDVGDRPELDTLGPFRWSPTAAAAWELEDHTGKVVSSSDFEGRPVVVIFYLGAGCLHCVEQLHEFAPRLPKFEEQGIDVIAISTENREEVAAAIKNFSEKGDFPIRLLANAEQDIFRSYRAYDDFEDMPLHGTFLIDAEGMVRWQDISYEPFLEPDFLLDEAKRILQ